MFFKQATWYRLVKDFPISSESDFRKALSTQQFQPPSTLQVKSHGWGSILEVDDILYAHKEQILCQVYVEKKIIPTSLINIELNLKLAKMEENLGSLPSRKIRASVKQEVIDELTKKAFSSINTIPVWFDMENRWVSIGSTSNADLDLIHSLLSKTFGTFPLLPIKTKTNVAAAMTYWLFNECGPEYLILEDDYSIHSVEGGQKREIKYKNYHLSKDEMQCKSASKFLVSRMAMTWRDKIYFELAEDLSLKKIISLNKLMEETEQNDFFDEEDGAFRTNFILMTGLFGTLFEDLIYSLDGEQ